MSIAGDILIAGEAVLVATHSMESVTIAGTVYSCFVMESTIGDDFGMGGYTKEDFHRVAIPRNLIAVIPAEGDAAILRGVTMSVIRIQRDDAEAPIVLDIGPTSSKRQS